ELAAVERQHAAVELAQGLRVGADCPVCQRPVTALPHPEVPADLLEAKASADWASQAVTRARSASDQAGQATAVAGRDADEVTRRLADVTATLLSAPPEDDVNTALAAIAQADESLAEARRSARAARQALTAAEQQRTSLTQEERRAWVAFSAARDS